MASGSPSNRRHTSITCGRFWSVSTNDGSTAAARCMNSSTAGGLACCRPAGRESSAAEAVSSGSTITRCSPEIRNTSRLVARILRLVLVRSSRSAKSAHASVRCSQLSRISSTRRSTRNWASDSAASPVPVSRAAGRLRRSRHAPNPIGAHHEEHRSGPATNLSRAKRAPSGGRPEGTSPFGLEATNRALGVSGYRRIVSDGDSPNRSRYMAANRPVWVKPCRKATSATLTPAEGSSPRSSSRALSMR